MIAEISFYFYCTVLMKYISLFRDKNKASLKMDEKRLFDMDYLI